MFSSLPTDNLYKFLAISALAGAIFFSHFVLEKADIESKSVNESADILYKLAKELKETTDEIDKLEIKQIKTELENRQLNNLMAYKKIIKGYAETQEEKIKSANEIIESWRNTFKVSFLALSALSICGFFLWYIQLQRPQDIEFKNSIKSKKSSNTYQAPGRQE